MYGSDPFATDLGPFVSRPSELSRMAEAEAAEDRFFAALLTGDVAQLGHLTTADFAIVDVFTGAVTDRAPFLEALNRRLLTFSRIELVERSTRLYGDVAIIVGRTEMGGSLEGTRFAAASRYTHVLALGADRRWRLATAQGTRIGEA